MSRKKKEKEERFCEGCDTPLVLRHKKKFCSNKCQMGKYQKGLLDDWLTNGTVTFNFNVPGYIKKYLFEKHGKKCSQCAWDKKNPITNKVPLEVDHIDGNAENNIESNLRLLCPNCHSLTPFFRNLNKGNGRKWRRESIYYQFGLSLKKSLI